MDQGTANGSWVLGNPQFLPAVSVIVCLLFLMLLFDFYSSRVALRVKLLILALRTAAIVLIGLCLLDPQKVSQRVIPGQNLIALLADESASMNVQESSSSQQTLGQVYQTFLTEDSPWQKHLQEAFTVRRSAFGSQLQSVEGFQNLSFEATSSDFQSALQSLEVRYRNRSLGGVLLFSDGNFTNTDLSEINSLAPIYPVVPDEIQDAVDLAIGPISVSESLFENSPVSVQVRILQTGQVNEAVRVSIFVDGPEQSEKQTVDLSASTNEDRVAKFDLRPNGQGVFFYRVEARLLSETQTDFDDTQSREATLINNQQLLVVNRDPYVARILYVAGRPNWEHKFLARALSEDLSLHLVSLVRIANREPKFDFQGRALQGSTLFRAFNDGEVDETDDTTQPIMVRLNTRDQQELSQGFPRTKSELYQYDAVILDDVESGFFTRDQLSLLENFVSERGGGFSMLGGINSFSSGNWKNTPVADFLPSYLTPAEGQHEKSGRMELSREGFREPWIRFRDQELEERTRLQNLPALKTFNRERMVKPGARVLASVVTESGQSWPAIVVQNFGKGRSASVLSGDFWRYSLNNQEQIERDEGKLWRQFCSWLTGNTPKRISAVAEHQSTGPKSLVRVGVQLLNENFMPAEGETVTLSVTQPDGSIQELTAQESLERQGFYEAFHSSRLAGGFSATVKTTAKSSVDGSFLETQVGWTSDPMFTEFQQTSYQLTRLEELAKQTGGQVVRMSEVPKFVEELQYQAMPEMETEVRPAWHSPLTILLALCLLSIEWGLRRSHGLP